MATVDFSKAGDRPAPARPAGPGMLRNVLAKVKRSRSRKGTAATILAILAHALQPLLRRRKYLVFDIGLRESRGPSVWEPCETLLIFGPENIDHMSAELRGSLETPGHQQDFDGIARGNRLFVVAHENRWLYRSYAGIVPKPGLQKTVFFGEFEGLPEIRGAEIAKAIPPRIARGIGKGLHARVLNEQLRSLQSLGYTRSVLYILAENLLSIRGAEAAGFHLRRSLTDWIFFRSLVAQRVDEGGRRSWRFFRQ